MQEKGSRDVAQAAVKLASTATREEEVELKSVLLQSGIKASALDYGGEFVSSINKIIEKTVILAKKDGIIDDSHEEEGSVAGAAHEAVIQIMQKAMGMNIGGKIAHKCIRRLKVLRPVKFTINHLKPCFLQYFSINSTLRIFTFIHIASNKNIKWTSILLYQ